MNKHNKDDNKEIEFTKCLTNSGQPVKEKQYSKLFQMCLKKF